MKDEYKELYQQFGLNVVYYRKKKRLSQTQGAFETASGSAVSEVKGRSSKKPRSRPLG